jgi:hypothetical protein
MARRIPISLGLLVGCLNFIAALAVFAEGFACADIWGACTPSPALVRAGELLSLPLSAAPVGPWAGTYSFYAWFALNSAIWGALTYAIACLAFAVRRI